LHSEKGLNMDLTVGEAQLLFNANEKIRDMADSGELKALHERCAELSEIVDTTFKSVAA